MKKAMMIVGFLLFGMTAKAQNTAENALQMLLQRNFVQALDICNALLAQSPNDASVLGVRSQVYTAMGNFDLAMQDADKALSIDANSARALYAKAEAFFYGPKDYRQALQQYDAAIRSNPQMSEAYAGKARALMAMQNFRDALSVVEDAIQKATQEDPELFFVRGQLNYQRARYNLAVDDYDRVWSLNSQWNTYQVFLNRGIANDAFQRPELALQDFTRAIAVDPNNAGGYIARGNILYNLARYHEAVEDFRKAEILAPDNAVITYNIGMSYLKAEDRISACRYFQRSCSQDNNNACRMMIVNCSDRRAN
jgi:tetratricopeptide (TPR) repeat protein